MRTLKLKTLLFSTALLLSGTTFAGTTGWINSDQPGGSGDWENIDRFVKITCRIEKKKRGKWKTYHPGDRLPKGYTCDKQRGGWCINKNTKSKRCRNMQVKYTWTQTGQETHFFDSDRPGGSGDWENLDRYMKLECSFGDNNNSNNIHSPGYESNGYTCHKLRIGGWCINKQTTPRNSCRTKPVTVRYSW